MCSPFITRYSLTHHILECKVLCMGRDPATPTEDLAGWETQLRKGALSLAVLAILWRERLYGLEILKRLDADGGLSISEGAIYPLLNRMKAEGLVAAEWVE